MPGFIKPQLATLKSKAPRGEQWIHEIKFDGYRVQVHLNRGAVKVYTRNGLSGQKHSSYRYDREVRVGADLPSSGVTYYDVPREYGVTKYRYTVVNDRTVLVDPGTHRIIEVID